MNLFTELKRRNVFRVGIAYIVAAWLLVQIVDLSLDIVGAEDWVLRLVALLLALGFVPAVIFAWAFELTPEGIKREKDIIRDTSITHVTAKKLDFVTIGLLLAVVVVVAVDRMLPSESEKGSEAFSHDSSPVIPAQAGIHEGETPPENVKAPPPAKSIAVLPFVNMSDDASNEYFSDGISEEILNALAKVKDLKVAGRTSSFAFKGENQDLRVIGEALGVSHILEGSVRKAGNRVRITAQLIQVDDGFHLWSENYDRELDDVFAIQDEISAAILSELKAHLIGDEQVTVARTDSQAYDLYLLATQRIYERNEASLQMAADLLNQAIAIDAKYAPVHAQLGIATLLLSTENYGSIPPAEAHATAKKHLDQALALDSQQAEAMAGLGLHAMNALLDYPLAMQWLEQARAINPNLTNANLWLATALGLQGELQRDLEILQQTFARDPLHPPTFNNLAQTLALSGKFDQARESLEGLKRYLPSNAGLIGSQGKVEAIAGNFAASDRLLTEAIEREPLNNVDRLWFSGSALASRQFERVADIGTDNFKAVALDHLNRTEEALLIGEKWIGQGNTPVFHIGILNRRGRFEEAVEFIESRWPDLDSLDRAFPNRNGVGAELMVNLAQSYSQVGNEQKFNDVMQRARTSLEQQVKQDANNWILQDSRAVFAMLEGDREQALQLLEQLADMGGLPRTNFTGEFSVYAPLRGDPRFEAILQRLQEHLDSERAELGLATTAI